MCSCVISVGVCVCTRSRGVVLLALAVLNDNAKSIRTLFKAVKQKIKKIY